MGIHISLGILVWGYTKHRDTHITVTSVQQQLTDVESTFIHGIMVDYTTSTCEVTQRRFNVDSIVELWLTRLVTYS
jgi:hypothetical protein